MIRKSYPWLMLAAGVLIGLVVSGRVILRAQDRPEAKRSHPAPSLIEGVIEEPSRPAKPPGAADRPAPGPGAGSGTSAVPSVHDVLARPYRFPFSRPTSIASVCAHLKETLKVPVVLDLAALGRQDVEPEDTVQLELDGVRLKTGLKLLLDQLGLTYHVVAEDNLLIITDREGSDDPLDRVWSELRALHRDLHDVQDAVDDLTDVIAGENGDGPHVRKPTIIEEMPENIAPPQVEEPREKPQEPAKKPNGAQRPAPGPRSTPARIPLRGSRRAL
jgi:hypothetical protein